MSPKVKKTIEISRESLARFLIAKDFLGALRKGPSNWPIRGTTFTSQFTRYNGLTEKLFSYTFELSQGAPEVAIRSCRNAIVGMEMFHRTPFVRFKKRPFIHERLDRISHLYEETRTLRYLAEVVSPRPDGAACGSDPDEILSRFGSVGFNGKARKDVRILRNAWLHKGVRYIEGGVAVFDDGGRQIGFYSAERIKELDQLLYELFDWAISAVFGAIWETPSLWILVALLFNFDKNFAQDFLATWKAAKALNPHLFKVRKIKSNKRGAPEWTLRLTNQYNGYLESIPEAISIDELSVRIAQAMYESALAFQIVVSDAADYISFILPKSEVSSLQDLLSSGLKHLKQFTEIPIEFEAFASDLLARVDTSVRELPEKLDYCQFEQVVE